MCIIEPLLSFEIMGKKKNAQALFRGKGATLKAQASMWTRSTSKHPSASEAKHHHRDALRSCLNLVIKMLGLISLINVDQ